MLNNPSGPSVTGGAVRALPSGPASQERHSLQQSVPGLSVGQRQESQAQQNSPFVARKGAHGERNSVAGILMDDGLNSLNDRIANMNVQSNNTMD